MDFNSVDDDGAWRQSDSDKNASVKAGIMFHGSSWSVIHSGKIGRINEGCDHGFESLLIFQGKTLQTWAINIEHPK